MSSSITSYESMLDNVKSAVMDAAMLLTDPLKSRSSISSMKERVQKQYTELKKLKEYTGVNRLVAELYGFINLLSGTDYDNIIKTASNIENITNTVIKNKIKEETAVEKPLLPKCNPMKLNNLYLFANVAISSTKRFLETTSDIDKADALKVKNAKLVALENMIKDFEGYKEVDQYKKLICQAAKLKKRLSKDIIDLKEVEDLDKVIAASIRAIIKNAIEKSEPVKIELMSIPECLQEKKVQDELGQYIPWHVLKLMEAPKFKPLLSVIEVLFKRLSSTDDSYSKDEIHHILTESMVNPDEFLFLLLFEAVKCEVDLLGLGLLTPSSAEEKAVILSLKNLSYSDIGSYLIGKSKVLLDEKQDSELKKAIGKKVHSIAREDFTHLLDYVRRYYLPSTVLLTATVMNTEDRDVKKKLLEFLPEDKQKVIEKIQAFVDATDTKKSIELAKDLIEEESSSSQFLEALTFIAGRDFGQFEKILSIIFSQEIEIFRQEVSQIITTVFREIAEKSVEEAEKYLDILQEKYTQTPEYIEEATVSVVLAVSYKNIDKAIEIALKSECKKLALRELFESLGSRDLIQAKTALCKIKDNMDFKCSFISLVMGICNIDPDQAIKQVSGIDNAEVQSECYEKIIWNVIDRDRLLGKDMEQAIAITAKLEIGSTARDVFSKVISIKTVKIDVDKAVQIASGIVKKSIKLDCYKAIIDKTTHNGDECAMSAILKYEEDADFKTWANALGAIFAIRKDLTKVDQAVCGIVALKSKKLQQSLKSKLLEEVCLVNVNEGMKLVDTLYSTPKKREMAKYMQAVYFKDSNPEKALQIAQSLKDVRQKINLMIEIIINLGKEKPDAAVELLKGCLNLPETVTMLCKNEIFKSYKSRISDSIRDNNSEELENLVGKVAALAAIPKNKNFLCIAFKKIYLIFESMKDKDHVAALRAKLIEVNRDMNDVFRLEPLKTLAQSDINRALETVDTYSDFSQKKRDCFKIIIARNILKVQLSRVAKDAMKKTIAINSYFKIICSLNNKQVAFETIQDFLKSISEQDEQSIVNLLPTLSGMALEAGQLLVIDKAIKNGKFEKAIEIINTIDDEEIKQELLQALQEELETAATTESSPESESGSEEI